MTRMRNQIAFVAADPALYDKFLSLSRYLDSQRFMPRQPDFPQSIDDSTLWDTVTGMLLLSDGRRPLTVVAVSGNDVEVGRSAKLFKAVRRRTPSALVMCPKGYEHMKATTDIPHFATGHPPETYDIRMTILVGDINGFKDYDNQMFGRPTCLPLKSWDPDNLKALAARLCSVAGADHITC